MTLRAFCLDSGEILNIFSEFGIKRYVRQEKNNFVIVNFHFVLDEP